MPKGIFITMGLLTMSIPEKMGALVTVYTSDVTATKDN